MPYAARNGNFQDVAFVLYHTMRYGYPQNLLPNPIVGVKRQEYLALTQLMMRIWITFVNYADFHNHLGGTYQFMLLYAPLTDQPM